MDLAPRPGRGVRKYLLQLRIDHVAPVVRQSIGNAIG